MKRVIARMVIVAAALGVFAATPATAQEVTVCLDAEIVVQGETLVDESQCHTLPPA